MQVLISFTFPTNFGSFSCKYMLYALLWIIRMRIVLVCLIWNSGRCYPAILHVVCMSHFTVGGVECVLLTI